MLIRTDFHQTWNVHWYCGRLIWDCIWVNFWQLTSHDTIIAGYSCFYYLCCVFSFFYFFCSVLTVVILLKSAHGECPKNYISRSDGNRTVCCVPAYNCELGKLTSLLYSLFPVDCILHCLQLVQDFFSGLDTSAGNKIDFFQILA